MPEGLTMADQLMFQALSILYARYQRGELTREDASAEKGKLLYAYHRSQDEAEAARRMSNWHVRLLRAVEGAQCRYRKERTVEAADALSAVLDGVGVP